MNRFKVIVYVLLSNSSSQYYDEGSKIMSKTGAHFLCKCCNVLEDTVGQKIKVPLECLRLPHRRVGVAVLRSSSKSTASKNDVFLLALVAGWFKVGPIAKESYFTSCVLITFPPLLSLVSFLLFSFVDVPDIIKECRSYLPFEKVTGYCSHIFVLQVFVGDFGFKYLNLSCILFCVVLCLCAVQIALYTTLPSRHKPIRSTGYSTP